MFIRRFAAALAAALLAAIAPAVAEDADPPIDCANATSTVEMNFCAEKDYNAADAKLNDAYSRALAHIAQNGGEKPYDAKSWEDALRASQRAWVAFRDADCKGLVPMSWGGGTGTTSAILGCMHSKTEARIKELNELYESGD